MQELIDALGPAAQQVFRGLPLEGDALTRSTLHALEGGELADVLETNHRLTGLAELSVLANVVRGLQVATRDGQTVRRTQRTSHVREIKEAVAAIPWDRYGC